MSEQTSSLNPGREEMATTSTTGTCGGDEEVSELQSTTPPDESTAHNVNEKRTRMEESTDDGRICYPSQSSPSSSTECSSERVPAEGCRVSAAASSGDRGCDVASDMPDTCTPPAGTTAPQSVPAPTGVVAARITGEAGEESAATTSTTVGSEMRPLSTEDIKKFEEDGFVMLHRAFDPAVAAAGR